MVVDLELKSVKFNVCNNHNRFNVIINTIILINISITFSFVT